MGETRACPGLGMVDALAQQLWATGLVVRDTEFGAILRHARLSADHHRPSPADPVSWAVPMALQALELSFDPALHRTLTAVWTMRAVGDSIPLEAREWLEWVMKATAAVQRIEAKCWIDVPREIWQVFLDADDAIPPAIHEGFTALRRDQQGRPALSFAGLNAMSVRQSLSTLSAGIRATAVATDARRAADQLSRRPDLLQELVAVRQVVGAEALTPKRDETLADACERSRRNIDNAYLFSTELLDRVIKLRAYNLLITRAIWALLGLAEQFEPLEIKGCAGAFVDEIVAGQRHIHLTTTDQATGFPRTSHPVWLKFGSPLDGLYFVLGYTMAIAGAAEADLHLVAFDPVQ